MEELEHALEEVRQESRSHFSVDALPARQRLVDAVAAVPRAWEQRALLDQFFIFAVDPEAAVQAGPMMVAKASRIISGALC